MKSLQIRSDFINYQGFLILELLLAITIFIIFVVSLGKYQQQILMYQKASQELYLATLICENQLESCWANQKKQSNSAQALDLGIYQVSTTRSPGPMQAYNYVSVRVCWQNCFGKKQAINMDSVCL
jgi:Tfp pilus assembly protein PilV